MFDLPSLKSDPHGVLFHSGMFDPTKVTPVIYAEDSGPSQDYANADVYATVPGDANLDGKVDFSDLPFWRSTMEWRMSARSAVTLGATGLLTSMTCWFLPNTTGLAPKARWPSGPFPSLPPP